MFISTFPVLSTDLTTEAPGQFGKAPEDKLLNHLENVLESGIHQVFPLPYLLTQHKPADSVSLSNGSRVKPQRNLIG